MALTVGLTGGIGSGKSTVSAELARLGAVVIDYDQLARDVVEPGTPALAAIVERFGADVMLEDGTLDRAALGSIVFAEEHARRDLEAITHAAIGERAAQIATAAAADAIVVHDNPLLVEMGMAAQMDVVVVVDVPEHVQVERLMSQRGMTEQDARSRIAAQASREQRVSVADLVIDNTGPVDDLAGHVHEVWRTLVDKTAG
ncbi:MAG: dephospho-CoA kinase [Aeromicrobium sp.]|uniref:dephospho-CoA kinase n=1 Tax=Aeromicrobium sp. TaxID=1871063 RepID=UPI003C5D21F1